MARKRATLAIADFDNIPAEALIPEDEQPYEIPAHWKWVLLGSAVRTSGDKTDSFDGTEKYVGLEHLEKGGGINEYGDSSTLKSTKSRFKPGQLLYGKLRPYLDKHVIVDFEGVCSTDILVFEESPLVEMRWLETWMSSALFIDQANAGTKGINLPRVSDKYLASTPFPLPPLDEQMAIVEKLQTTNQKLDDVLERLEQFFDDLTVKQSSIVKVILAGRGSRNDHLENDPSSWRTETLGRVLKVSSGRGLTAKKMNPEGEVPVYGGNGITGWHDESCYPAGTIAIGRVGYYCGAVHMSVKECWVTDNALVVRFDEEAIDRRYLFHLLAHTNLRVNTSSSAQPLISGKKIYGIEVRIPSLSMQKKLVGEVERSVDFLVQSRASVTQARDMLLTTRRALRQGALRGLA